MHHRRLPVAVPAIVLCFAGVAAGVPVEFTLDPAASTFEIGGTFNGAALSAQMPGSTVVGYTGVLSVDIDRANGRLSTQSSTLVAMDQPMDQQPTWPSNPGANYGLRTGGAAPTLVAIRGIDLFLQADNAPFNGAAPTFDEVPMFVNGGTLFYGPAAGTVTAVDLHGNGGGGRIIGPLTLTVQGNLEVLTIPIQTSFSPFTNNTDTVEVSLAGRAVATRVIPEPTAAAAFATAGAIILLVRRRRARVAVR